MFHIIALSAMVSLTLGLRLTEQEKMSAVDEYEKKQPVVVFLAGVEGAAHHFAEAVFKAWAHDRSVYHGGNISWPDKWGPRRVETAEGIPILQKEFEALESNTVSLIWRSYPFGPGLHHVRRMLNRPNLKYIAQAASNAGVKLKVIFMLRDLVDCLIADCVHRQFESCEDQLETLNSNGRALAAQIRKLDPEIVECFEFGNQESMYKSFSDVYGPQSTDLIDKLWSPSHSYNFSDKVWQPRRKKLRKTMYLLRKASNICKQKGKADKMLVSNGTAKTPFEDLLQGLHNLSLSRG